MASNLYRIDDTKVLGAQALNLLARIGADFAQLKALRLKLIQSRDGDGSSATHYVETAALFGYVDAAGDSDSGTVARASFEEIDAFVSNGGPSLEQCSARHAAKP
jgi:hypothetical protein